MHIYMCVQWQEPCLLLLYLSLTVLRHLRHTRCVRPDEMELLYVEQAKLLVHALQRPSAVIRAGSLVCVCVCVCVCC
jgi:hypothetical protein